MSQTRVSFGLSSLQRASSPRLLAVAALVGQWVVTQTVLEALLYFHLPLASPLIIWAICTLLMATTLAFVLLP